MKLIHCADIHLDSPMQTHMTARQIDALYNYMTNGSVLNYIHLTQIIKNKRIKILMHKEMLHLPTLLWHKCGVRTIDNRQREHYTLHLQLTIGRKVEEEVVEQLVGCLGHWSLGYNLIQSVGYRFKTVRLNTVRISHYRRLFV